MNIAISVDLRPKLCDARDQGERPTCLAFAVSAAHEFRLSTANYLSPEYLHYAGAQRAGVGPAVGLSREGVRDALMHDGQPLETAWPYSATAPSAASWKPPSSVQVTHKAELKFAVRSVAQVRAVLMQEGTPVTLHIRLSAAMFRPDSDGAVRAQASEKDIARHALLAVGSGGAVDGTYLLVRNSWGVGWGIGGHCWLHDSYLEPRLEVTGTIT